MNRKQEVVEKIKEDMRSFRVGYIDRIRDINLRFYRSLIEWVYGERISSQITQSSYVSLSTELREENRILMLYRSIASHF